MGTKAKQANGVGGLYSIMQTMESKLGGGEGVEGIYGSITATGMQKIFDCMHHSCALNAKSALVDIGAGLGRPLLHGALRYGLSGAYGVELDPVKCSKAEAFIRNVMRELVARGIIASGHALATPLITQAPVERVASLDPATHAYSFWEGVPRDGKAAFGRLFRKSQTLKAVAVVQRAMRNVDPCLEMQQLGFGPLLLIKSFSVNMSGSGRSFTAYIFSKIPAPAADLLRRAPRASDATAASPPPAAAPLAGAADAASAAARLVRLRTSGGRAEGSAVAEVVVVSEGADLEGRRLPFAGASAAAVAAAGSRGAGGVPGGSPAGKRGLGVGDAAYGEAVEHREEGSPSKRVTRRGADVGQRCDDQDGGDDGSWAAAGGDGASRVGSSSCATHPYGLRPKRLDLAASVSSGASGGGGEGRGSRAGSRVLRSAPGVLGRVEAGKAGILGRSGSSSKGLGAGAAAPVQQKRAAAGVKGQGAGRGGGAGGGLVAAGCGDEGAGRAGRDEAEGGGKVEAEVQARAETGSGAGQLRQAAISSMFRQRKARVASSGKAADKGRGRSGRAADVGGREVDLQLQAAD